LDVRVKRKTESIFKSTKNLAFIVGEWWRKRKLKNRYSFYKKRKIKKRK